MDVSDVGMGQRFAAGVLLSLVGVVLPQANLGLPTHLAEFATLLGVGLLGASFESPITSAFGSDSWGDLPAGRQAVGLLVMAIVAVVLYLVVSLIGGLAAQAI